MSDAEFEPRMAVVSFYSEKQQKKIRNIIKKVKVEVRFCVILWTESADI